MSAASQAAADIAAEAATQSGPQLARVLAPRAVAAAASRGRQAALAARSVAVTADGITAGGSRTVSPARGRARPAGAIYPGTEWGSGRYRAFPPYQQAGYWLNPTLDGAGPDIDSAYGRALARGDVAWSGRVSLVG